MKNRTILGVTLAAILTLAVGAYLLYSSMWSTPFDARLQTALEAVQSVHTYQMHDDTRATLPGRTIEISGLYMLDFDSRSFSSDSTTTLTTAEKPRERDAFTLAHRSIADDVYVKIETTSALLKKNIPYSPEWRHFQANAIPSRFTDIAVPGPILDNLALLGSKGSYLTPLGEPTEQTLASTTYHVYSFLLSKQVAEVPQGPLRSLIDLIATGTVSLWIDEAPSVRIIHLNGSSYDATTTIISVNTPVSISPPVTSE